MLFNEVVPLPCFWTRHIDPLRAVRIESVEVWAWFRRLVNHRFAVWNLIWNIKHWGKAATMDHQRTANPQLPLTIKRLPHRPNRISLISKTLNRRFATQKIASRAFELLLHPCSHGTKLWRYNWGDLSGIANNHSSTTARKCTNRCLRNSLTRLVNNQQTERRFSRIGNRHILEHRPNRRERRWNNRRNNPQRLQQRWHDLCYMSLIVYDYFFALIIAFRCFFRAPYRS